MWRCGLQALIRTFEPYGRASGVYWLGSRPVDQVLRKMSRSSLGWQRVLNARFPIREADKIVGQARNDEVPRRVQLLREALALWRGAAMQDVGVQDSAAFDAAVVRLEGLRLTATEERADAEVVACCEEDAAAREDWAGFVADCEQSMSREHTMWSARRRHH